MFAILRRSLGQILYRFSDVIHQMRKGVAGNPFAHLVNNVVGARFWQDEQADLKMGRAAVRITKTARWTSIGQIFDRSSDPELDTHSQVLTIQRLIYTACAPARHQA